MALLLGTELVDWVVMLAATTDGYVAVSMAETMVG